MTKPLIAISGKMKSGKSTLARALSEHLGIPIYPLAEPIKRASAILGDPDPWGNDKLRWMQQGIGQLCTDYDTDWFVNLWFEDHEEDMLEHGAIVDDIRRVPEFEAFHASDFLMVRLDASKQTQIERGAADDEKLYHPTETGLDHLSLGEWDLFLGEGLTVPERLGVITRYFDLHDPNTTLPDLATYITRYEGIYDDAGNRLEPAVPTG